MVFPTLSIAESFAHPTSMFLRNLMAMDTEEMIRAQPMDSVVLIGGCDKNLPARSWPRSPAPISPPSSSPPALCWWASMQRGNHRRLHRLPPFLGLRHIAPARSMSPKTELYLRTPSCPTIGTCSTMATASTMALLVEALGLALPCPPPHSQESPPTAAESPNPPTRRAAEIVAHSPTPADPSPPRPSATRERLALQAIGGSTNALIHLTAIAARRGPVLLKDLDRLSREVSVLLNLKPSGTHYMEHLHHAGGLPALLRELNPLLDTSPRTVTGYTLAEINDEAEEVPNQDVIRTLASPSKKERWPSFTATSRPTPQSSNTLSPHPTCSSTPAAP